MKKILLVGGGGHCRSILDIILSTQEYDDVGIIDKDKKGKSGQVPVIGNDEDLKDLFKKGWEHAFISVGSIGNTTVRQKLFDLVREIGFEIPTIIDPSAIIANDVIIEEGCFIGKGSVINTGTRIGRCSIINTSTVIEHDCNIGSFSHISPGAVLCGQVTVGDHSHVGAGSVLIQSVSIGERALVGAGSVVVDDIPSNSKAYGNPCRVVKK